MRYINSTTTSTHRVVINHLAFSVSELLAKMHAGQKREKCSFIFSGRTRCRRRAVGWRRRVEICSEILKTKYFRPRRFSFRARLNPTGLIVFDRVARFLSAPQVVVRIAVRRTARGFATNGFSVRYYARETDERRDTAGGIAIDFSSYSPLSLTA